MKRATKKLDFYADQVNQQKAWIKECGGNLSGYVQHYGKPTDPDCYGNGGYAIFAADMNALHDLENKLSKAIRKYL